MNYRVLGRTGIKVSEIGFGGWGIGGGWGAQDDSEAERAIRAALDQGVNFFDTALGYGMGHSETIIGKATQEVRDSIVIATKIPPKTFRWPVLPTDPVSETFPADWVIECTEKSLRNLGAEYVDIQQLHAWTEPYAEQMEWYEALTKLKEQGKIRAFGVSANDWDPYGPTNGIEADLFDTVQVIYNIFEQRPAEKLLPAAYQNRVGIIVRVPFEEGLLTGKMGPGYQFHKDDWRAEWLTPERLQEAASHTEKLTPFLNEDHATLPALALKFCLTDPASSTVIPGMRSERHVQENCAASGKLLSASEFERLKNHAWAHGWKYPWAAD